jgi:D-proline reductase (dithiol) PrdB
MALEYLPLMTRSSAAKSPRTLVSPSRLAWCPVTKPVNQSRVALLTSAALRLKDQPPFTPKVDLSYRLVSSNPQAGEMIIDHHSPIGAVPRQDPEIVFPRSALATLLEKSVVGTLSPVHISFMGSSRRYEEIENELAPSIARELQRAAVDLAILAPY